MTNLEKFIEVMNNTFNAQFKPENMKLECSPCGALKKPVYACEHFRCDGCKQWWQKEYADLRELSKEVVMQDREIIRQKLGKEEIVAQEGKDYE